MMVYEVDLVAWRYKRYTLKIICTTILCTVQTLWDHNLKVNLTEATFQLHFVNKITNETIVSVFCFSPSNMHETRLTTKHLDTCLSLLEFWNACTRLRLSFTPVLLSHTPCLVSPLFSKPWAKTRSHDLFFDTSKTPLFKNKAAFILDRNKLYTCYSSGFLYREVYPFSFELRLTGAVI